MSTAQGPTVGGPNIAGLPTEVALFVFSQLDPPSLARCKRVARAWRWLANDEKVWRQVAVHRAWVDPACQSINDVMRDITPSQARSLRRSKLTLESSAKTTTDGADVTPSIPTSSPNSNGPDSDPYRRAHLTSPIAQSCASSYYAFMSSFQELCKRKWCLDRAWQSEATVAGLGPASADAQSASGADDADASHVASPTAQLHAHMRNIDAAPPIVWNRWNEMDDGVEEVARDVWRIKTCPAESVLISTGRRGGVRVVDIQTGSVLWRLDSRLTRRYPHVEYDRGYLVLDRVGHGNFEIWSSLSLDDEERRGAFDVFATLESPRPTRALRFQFPFLCVATQDGHVLLWDVPKQQLVQDISLEGTSHVDANINYIDFDDDFVFLVGVGAKCVTIISRRLGKPIWTLADHFENKLRPPTTFKLVEEPATESSAQHCSLERRRLKRVRKPSPWQKAPNRQNLAQRMMTPVQSWSAIHPDFRTNTLVVLGDTNVLLIRDYASCFRAWEAREALSVATTSMGQPPTLPLVLEEALQPAMFADLYFNPPEKQSMEFTMLGERTTNQLAVADSRAICITSKPMLLDLDPERLTRDTPDSIPMRRLGVATSSAGNTLQREDGTDTEDDGEDDGDDDDDAESFIQSAIVSDADAGFSVYNTIRPHDENPNAQPGFTSSLESCSCVQIDGGAIYAVQHHDVAEQPGEVNMATVEYSDVLVWDFAQAARDRW